MFLQFERKKHCLIVELIYVFYKTFKDTECIAGTLTGTNFIEHVKIRMSEKVKIRSDSMAVNVVL